MLAASKTPDLGDLSYPLFASPKLDGIRCLIIDGKPVSRNLKPIPNRHIRKILTELNLPAFDGELMLRYGDFNKVQSAVMSEDGEPAFEYHVFDLHDIPNQGFGIRYATLLDHLDKHKYGGFVQPVVHRVCNNSIELQQCWDEWVRLDYEGAITRSRDGYYKHGRSTVKQGWMVKLKKWHDDEALIVGFEELMHNENTAEIDALDHQVRSKQKAGMVGGNTLGALKLMYHGPGGATDLKVGTGFSAAERQEIWDNKDTYYGKKVTFKYQELSEYGVPRFPVFLHFREAE